MEMTPWPLWTAMRKANIIIPIYGANPENCYIHSRAKIGRELIIWPDVTIGDEVVIDTNCEIGKGATIIGNIKIGKNVTIGHHVEITGEGYIGDNCKITSDNENPRMKNDCKVSTSAA